MTASSMRAQKEPFSQANQSHDIWLIQGQCPCPCPLKRNVGGGSEPIHNLNDTEFEDALESELRSS